MLKALLGHWKRRALAVLDRGGKSAAEPLWQHGGQAAPGADQRRLDLVAGAGAADAVAIRTWLSGHAGRSAVLVLQHEGLKTADFGCEVFTQHELLGAEIQAGIAAECEAAIRALCDRLRDVQLAGVEVAADVLREALLAAPRLAEVARAARLLFERGFRHVAVVVSGYSHLDGAVLAEAKSRGLAAPDAMALTPREGHLVGLPVLTRPTMTSGPQQWETRTLARVEGDVAEPADFVALGFAPGPRRDFIEAVLDAAVRGGSDQPRRVVIPELTVGDPAQVAETLARLLTAWRTDVARRTAGAPQGWESLGRRTMEALESRVLELEDSIVPMLRRLARLERLAAAGAWRRPVVVVDEPAVCSLPPERPRDLHDHGVRFVRLPADIDTGDDKVSAILAQNLAGVLAEERSAVPVDGPELHIVLGVRPDGVAAVSGWLEKLDGRRAVLAMHYDPIGSSDFGCEVYRELDLVPTNSEIEEEVYKAAQEHRSRRQAELDDVRYVGLPLTLDFYRAVAPPVERMMQLLRAARLLFERGYDHVAVVFGTDNDSYGALVLEARACGVMPANGAVRRVVGGELRRDHGWSMPSVPASPRQWQERVKKREAQGRDAASVAVVALSSEPNYLRNGRAVIAALVAREPRLLLIVPRREGFGWAFESGLPAEPIDTGVGLVARDPERLNQAAGAFLSALHELASTDVANVRRRDWRRLGEATCSFHDLHGTRRDAVAYALRRHLAQLDRLDEVLAGAQPGAIYKFPHTTTIIDGSLAALAQVRGIRQVASIFMSIDDRYRNMDRARQDVITVLGEAQSEIVSANIPAAEVICAGQPEMDIMMRDWSPAAALEHARAAMPGWDGKQKVVLVATSNFDAAGEPTWVRELCRRAAERGDAHVLVKLHPATPVERYRQKVVAGGPVDVSLVADPNIAPYLQIASVVVTDVSHAGKIAVYLGRPLMVVNVSGKPYPYHRFDDDGVALGAYSLDAVGTTLDRLLDGHYEATHRADFIRREFTSDDNRASDRIAELVLSLRRT